MDSRLVGRSRRQRDPTPRLGDVQVVDRPQDREDAVLSFREQSLHEVVLTFMLCDLGQVYCARRWMAAGGTTVAVLAGGLDRFYPAGHDELLQRVAATGCVIAEAPSGVPPTRWRFLARNHPYTRLSLEGGSGVQLSMLRRTSATMSSPTFL